MLTYFYANFNVCLLLLYKNDFSRHSLKMIIISDLNHSCSVISMKSKRNAL